MHIVNNTMPSTLSENFFFLLLLVGFGVRRRKESHRFATFVCSKFIRDRFLFVDNNNNSNNNDDEENNNHWNEGIENWFGTCCGCPVLSLLSLVRNETKMLNLICALWFISCVFCSFSLPLFLLWTPLAHMIGRYRCCCWCWFSYVSIQ